MNLPFDRAYESICRWAEAQGIHVSQRPMPAGQAGEFDGTSVTMNASYSAEERVYYLIHALGSIILWSRDRSSIQTMFDRVKQPAEVRAAAPAQHERAIVAYRVFEGNSSSHAVWLLVELGFPELVRPYSIFMQADLDSMCEFHRTGSAPAWRPFFAAWQAELAAGRRKCEWFLPQPVPPFSPLKIERQQILQQQESANS